MSLVSDVIMVAENYQLHIVDIIMICDLLVLNFISNVTLATTKFSTPLSTSLLVSVAVSPI